VESQSKDAHDDLRGLRGSVGGSSIYSGFESAFDSVGGGVVRHATRVPVRVKSNISDASSFTSDDDDDGLSVNALQRKLCLVKFQLGKGKETSQRSQRLEEENKILRKKLHNGAKD